MNGSDWEWLAILGWGISHGVFDPQTGLGAVLCAWLSRKPWLPIAAALLIAIGDTYLLPGQFARFGEWGPWVIAGRFIGAFLQGMIVSGIAVGLRRHRQRIARNKEPESST